jgi:hypothetical protein
LYYGDDYYYEVYNDYVSGYFWSSYDDYSYNWECEDTFDYGWCYYGGYYGDIMAEWWYEDDGATYVTYTCDPASCETCVYDTTDWTGECTSDEGGSEGGEIPDDCTDYPESSYVECLGDDYYYYIYYGEDYYYETSSDYISGASWTVYDDGAYNYECENNNDWGYCTYGGDYGDIYTAWWYEDDYATYVTYSCSDGVCETCVYDTTDWIEECYEDDDLLEECNDYPDWNYYECSSDEYYYYVYYGEDYYYETYTEYESGWYWNYYDDGDYWSECEG